MLTSQIRQILLSTLFGLWTMANASTPVLTYGTYFGGTGDQNAAVAVTVDSAGDVVIVGYTTSQSLPGTTHAFQSTKATGFPNNKDVFIAKFDPTGRNLLWTTFLGGDGDDYPSAVTVDSSENIYLTGTSASTNFPLTPHAFMTKSLQTGTSWFIAKISADGSSLLYSSFLPFTGGSAVLAVNSGGEVYVGGPSYSSFAPITQGALNNGPGIYVARINSSGTGLIFGAFIGGSGINGLAVTSLTLDSMGNCYFAGATGLSNLPTTPLALQAQDPNAGLQEDIQGPAYSAFLYEINPTGSQILYGTYFGIRYYETGITQLALDGKGAVYFTGITNAATFAASPGAFQTSAAKGFLGKLTPGKPTLDAFSYLPSISVFSLGSPFPSVRVGGQPATVYVSFPGPTTSLEVAELDPQSLGLVSSFVSASSASIQLFGTALAPPSSIWFVGTGSGSLGSLISADAYQKTPSSNSAAVLLQVAANTISMSANNLSFQWQVGSPGPAPQGVSLSGIVPTAFTASVSDGGWLSVSPGSGTTPANLAVSVNPNGLRPNTYAGTVTLTDVGASNSPLVIQVTLQVSAAPIVPTITSVFNAAGYQNGVSPGSFISIKGSNLSPVFYDDWGSSISNGQLPTQLDGVSVSIGGKPAFVYQITPNQINVQAPDIFVGSVAVTVRAFNVTSSPVTVTSQSFSPAFWPWPGNQPVATHADYSLAAKDGTFAGTVTVPAKPGEIITLWGTGFGPTNPPVAAGQLPGIYAGSPTQNPVGVSLNGTTISVVGAAISPYPGDYQIAIQIPISQPDGDFQIVATILGVQSPTMILSVHQ